MRRRRRQVSVNTGVAVPQGCPGQAGTVAGLSHLCRSGTLSRRWACRRVPHGTPLQPAVQCRTSSHGTLSKSRAGRTGTLRQHCDWTCPLSQVASQDMSRDCRTPVSPFGMSCAAWRTRKCGKSQNLLRMHRVTKPLSSPAAIERSNQCQDCTGDAIHCARERRRERP